MFGPDLLAAPVLAAGQAERKLYLPRGRWIDFWEGGRATPSPPEPSESRARKAVKGGGEVTVPAPLGQLAADDPGRRRPADAAGRGRHARRVRRRGGRRAPRRAARPHPPARVPAGQVPRPLQRGREGRLTRAQGQLEAEDQRRAEAALLRGGVAGHAQAPVPPPVGRGRRPQAREEGVELRPQVEGPPPQREAQAREGSGRGCEFASR